MMAEIKLNVDKLYLIYFFFLRAIIYSLTMIQKTIFSQRVFECMSTLKINTLIKGNIIDFMPYNK